MKKYESDYLEHAWLKKGAKAQKHKYVAREGTYPKYRYFYTMAEYKKWLNSNGKNKSIGDSINDIGTSISNFWNKGKDFLSDQYKKGKEAGSYYTAKGKEYISGAYKKASEAVEKVASSKEVQEVKKVVSEAVDKTAKAINKAVNSKEVQKITKQLTKTANIISEYAQKTISQVDKYVKENAPKVEKFIKKNLNIKLNSVPTYKGGDFINSILKTTGGQTAGRLLTGNRDSGTIADRASKALSNISSGFSHIVEDIKDWGKKTADDFKKLTKAVKNIVTDKEFRDILMSGDVSKAYKDFIKDNPEFVNIFKPKPVGMSDRKDRDAVNPFYDSGYPYTTNCYSCSISYDLRMKGFDVKAIPDIYGGLTERSIASIYKDGHFSPVNFSDIVADEDSSTDLAVYKMHQELDKQILAQSDGEDSSGFITIWWDGGGGHIFNYVVKDGKVEYVDTQPDYSDSENYNHTADIDEYLYYSDAFNDPENAINIMRTDNLEINEKTIKYVTQPSQVGDYADPDISATESEVWLACTMVNDLLYDYYENGNTSILTTPQHPLPGAHDFEVDMTNIGPQDIQDLLDQINEIREENNAPDFASFVEDFEYLQRLLERGL